MALSGQDLIDDARALADMEGSQFVTDTQFIVWANEAQEELVNVVQEAFGDHWFNTADTTIDNGGAIALPSFDQAGASPFRKLLGVSKDPGTPMRRSLRRFNFGQRDGARAEVKYRQEGAALAIEPLESSAGTYRVYYQPAPTALVDATSFLDPILEQWRGFLSTTMAIKALIKAERDTSALDRRLARLRLQIQQMATTRDVGEPGTIAEVVNETPRSRLWRR